MRTHLKFLLLALALTSAAPRAVLAQLETSLPVTAELGTSIAQEQFPVTLQLEQAALYMTNPRLSYIDEHRIAIDVTFQAYDHRPDAGIAISETGKARFSGRLDYEPGAKKVLLHDPQIDLVEFDRSNPASIELGLALRAGWGQHIKNPMRFDLPRHPYLIPFRQNIKDLAFDGQHILISVAY